MNKKYALIAIVVLVALSIMAPLAHAAETMFVYYETDENVSSFSGVHPSSDSDKSAYGQELTGNGQYLTKAAFRLNKTGSPTGTIWCGLWNQSGTDPGTNIENSTTTINIASLSTGTRTWYEFEFSGDTQLAAITTYYIIMFVYDGTLTSPTDVVIIGCDSVASTGTGHTVSYASSSWADSLTADLSYRFYTSSTASSASTTVDTAYIDGLTLSLTSFLVPILVILLPVALLIVMTKSTDKWIILIGITIGAALGYFFNLVPMWVVFLVVIGLIGMAYQSVRGGG